ncbi:alpha/beta hydrolase-fold protein [Xanthomarina sp. F1114]|uniref:alpha/beta hydrolase-fold protein n=1 Tax=Xanthomarina sp. F1114 TaxID=2996019 RepID=UPI00225E0FCF|nr:alpha/beta hydrolase-fold protein [Xanthomarina sp. F1114]MCX7549013.1 alpha/beta hydrolase-fold protein [Xanthomarina sp. F1114]
MATAYMFYVGISTKCKVFYIFKDVKAQPKHPAFLSETNHVLRLLPTINRIKRMKILSVLVLCVISSITYGQETDTLSFYSEAFKEERTVYIHKPELYNYKSDSLKFPVIYLLDGQHEWFVNPLLSDIHYLQYTHEIPNAIVVVIPHKNRNKECRIPDLKTELPLDIFITKELDHELSKYGLSDFKVLIGHSFSASFSLYSYYNHPNYYSSVIANTPLDKMGLLVDSFQKHIEIDTNKISISIGGIADSKDSHHRKKYNQLKEKHPDFFNSINVFEADYSAHNAVPIVSTPTLLTRVFESFSTRYTAIAKVNDEYELIDAPQAPEKEVEKVILASKIGASFYPPEIAEINGIASRYSYSNYKDYAIEIYKLGIEYYPHYYEFYLSLYELTLNTDKVASREHLEMAELLLKTVENNWKGKSEIFDEIKTEKLKNGW